MKSLGLFIARVVLGGYLTTHGAQKLFGAFGGRGLEVTAKHFESIGLKPGMATAALAGGTEFGGGILTATGIASPLGPIMLAGTMAIAAAAHRANGPLAADGGYELPLTNMAAAAALAAAGPGKLRLGPHLPPHLVRRAAFLGAILGGVSAYQMLNHRPEEVEVAVVEDEPVEAPADAQDAEPETAAS